MNEKIIIQYSRIIYAWPPSHAVVIPHLHPYLYQSYYVHIEAMSKPPIIGEIFISTLAIKCVEALVQSYSYCSVIKAVEF